MDANDEEIIQKVLNNTWWPFDQIPLHIVKELERRDKQQKIDDMEEAPL
jgi:hypothetical protein